MLKPTIWNVTFWCLALTMACYSGRAFGQGPDAALMQAIAADVDVIVGSSYTNTVDCSVGYATTSLDDSGWAANMTGSLGSYGFSGNLDGALQSLDPVWEITGTYAIGDLQFTFQNSTITDSYPAKNKHKFDIKFELKGPGNKVWTVYTQKGSGLTVSDEFPKEVVSGTMFDLEPSGVTKKISVSSITLDYTNGLSGTITSKVTVYTQVNPFQVVQNTVANPGNFTVKRKGGSPDDSSVTLQLTCTSGPLGGAN